MGVFFSPLLRQIVNYNAGTCLAELSGKPQKGQVQPLSICVFTDCFVQTSGSPFIVGGKIHNTPLQTLVPVRLKVMRSE